MKKFLLLLSILLLSAMYSLVQAQDLLLTHQNGVEFRHQPSLSQRMSGVKKVYVFYPDVSSQNDRYIYKNFVVYLQRLGLQVIEHGLDYRQVDASQNGYSAYILSCTEDITPYLDEVNILAVVINIMHGYGAYTGERMMAHFNFLDPINNYSWTEQIEPAGSAEKYIRQCQKTICSSYIYNSSYTYHPAYISSNYTKSVLQSYIDKGKYTPIEGIYEGDDYTLGVKKATDGSYYLIYHNSKEGAFGWQDGYVKAILRETSTTGVYRGTWYGRFFTKMDYKIIFENGMFSTYDKSNNKDIYIKMYPTSSMQPEQTTFSNVWSGSGFALKNGYIVTNYHVIEDARTITIQGVNGVFGTEYEASVTATDKSNDLALLKIDDSRFVGFETIPYKIKTSLSEVGEDCFVLGYPLTSTMGDEIKLTTGVVSSKTGFQGDVSLYQISAPIQPGNSGGPLFDGNGNLIGIVNAKHNGAENVGYAIKASYLNNLVESAVSTNIIPTTNSVLGQTLPNKVKKIKNFVFMIKCSGSDNSYSNGTSAASSSYNNSSSTRTVTNPKVTKNYANKLNVQFVTLSSTETVLTISTTNMSADGSTYYQWMNIDEGAYIVANGQKYQLRRAEGIAIAPNKTYYSYAGDTKTFKLYFPSIPTSATSIDFIESSSSEWRLYGIQLR